MDGVDRDHSTFSQTAERSDHNIATGSEGHSAVKFHGRFIRFAAHPHRSQRLRQLPVARSARGYVHFAIPGPQYGDCQMSRSAKAKQPHPVATLYARNPETAKTNNPRTQQWRRM